MAHFGNVALVYQKHALVNPQNAARLRITAEALLVRLQLLSCASEGWGAICRSTTRLDWQQVCAHHCTS